MSNPKETRFFDSWRYENGLEYYWDTYFKGWNGEKCAGEATPTYFGAPFVAKRIKESLPEVKLIAILRNPVERSYSDWWMDYSRGKEKESFEDAIRKNAQRIESLSSKGGAQNEYEWYGREDSKDCKKVVSKYGHYLEHGFYAQHLKRYLSLYDTSQLKIVFFEDLCNEPQQVVKDIWDFLEVDTAHDLEESIPRNIAFSNKRIKMLFNPVFRMNLHRLFPEGIRLKLRKIFSKIGQRPEMEKEIKAWLIDYFYEHNRQLETLTGRDVSDWNK
jgi:hypothetical protein